MTQPEVTAHQRRWLALALLTSTQFVVVLDATIVAIAMPSMGRDLGFAQEDLSWVVNAYLLMFGGFLLLGGRLSDLLGSRRLFVFGMTLFAVASMVGGLAPTPGTLIAARAAQGLGAALVSPAAMALVLTTFSDAQERNRAIGLWGSMGIVGGGAGYVLGGVLVEWINWRAVLYVNVPIGLVGVLLAPVLLRADHVAKADRARIDFAGAVTATGGLALLVYGLVGAIEAGWTSGRTIGVLAAAAVLLVAFVAIEARSDSPLVPLSIFRRPTLRAANIAVFLTPAGMVPTFFFLSLYTQNVLNFSPLESGLAQLPLAVVMAITSANASRLINRYGTKVPLIGSLSVLLVGMLWFTQISPSGSFLVDILGPSVLFACSGVAWVAMTIAATQDAGPGEAGLAAGLMNTTGQIGGALGLAVLVTVATSRSTSVLAGGETNAAVALTEGYQAALMVGSAIVVLALLAAVFLLPRPAAPAAAPPAAEAPADAASPDAGSSGSVKTVETVDTGQLN